MGRNEKDVVEFVHKCSVCRLVNVEHQKLTGVMQPLPILEWNWEDISMDFVVAFRRLAIGNNTI